MILDYTANATFQQQTYLGLGLGLNWLTDEVVFVSGPPILFTVSLHPKALDISLNKRSLDIELHNRELDIKVRNEQ